jgi:hypothetical protein
MAIENLPSGFEAGWTTIRNREVFIIRQVGEKIACILQPGMDMEDYVRDAMWRKMWKTYKRGWNKKGAAIMAEWVERIIFNRRCTYGRTC